MEKGRGWQWLLLFFEWRGQRWPLLCMAPREKQKSSQDEEGGKKENSKLWNDILVHSRNSRKPCVARVELRNEEGR